MRIFTSGLILVLLTLSSFAQSPSLSEQAYAAYQKKDFEASARLYLSAIKAGDQDWNSYYNGACALSLAGRKAEAFDLLGSLLGLGWADAGQLKGDADFKPLYEDARWMALVNQAATQEQQQKKFWDDAAFKTVYAPNLREEEKLAGLSKFWAEVKFNFANFDLVPSLDWDRLYLEFIPKVRQTKSTLEYYTVLRELCARLRDGHTNISYPNELRPEAQASPLLGLRWIEDRVIICRVYDESLLKDGVVPGLEIIEVDGMPVKQYAEQRVMPYQSASTPQDLMVSTYERALLAGSVKEPVALTLRDAQGKVQKKSFARVAPADRAKLIPRMPPFEFKLLPGNIGYVALNEFESDATVKGFESAFAEIAKTDALIIDVRNNGGGNSGNGWKVLSFLTDKPFQTSRWRTRQYRPSFRAWGTPGGWFEGKAGQQAPNGAKLYSKPVAVLISPRTYSAAEDFAVAFDVMQRGTLVGEATGGSTGQPLFFPLPGGGSARVCTKRDSYPDGREFVGKGVQPQLATVPTLADMRADRDTVLEAALVALRKGDAKGR